MKSIIRLHPRVPFTVARTFLLLTAVVLVVPTVQAQPSALISYQGYAESGGIPASGSLNVYVGLYTAPSGGTLAYAENHAATPFQDGVFAVALGGGESVGGDPYDWGGLDFSVPYWLEIEIDDDALTPRTPLRAVPHARTLVAPTRITGADASGAAVAVVNTATSGSSTGLYGEVDSPNGTGVWGVGLTRGMLGITEATAGTAWGVWGESASTTGRGVLGKATALTGETYGVAGAANSQNGRGVYGHATSTSGTNYGVYGRSESTNGVGVFGQNTSPSGGYGVLGESSSSSGRAVEARALATQGFTIALYASNASNDGTGVRGWATSTSGTTYGVWGTSSSTGGRGVYGMAGASSGLTYGVLGQSNSTSGRGVFGEATAGSGGAYGVHGRSSSSSGRGVYGEATATSGFTYGVWGASASTAGVGVSGLATATSGNTVGVYGQASSLTGSGVTGAGGRYGVFGVSDRNAGFGIYGEALSSTDGTGVYGQASTYGVYGTGGFYGVYGRSDVYGVYGTSSSGGGRGVMGYVTANSASASAVFGFATQPNAYAGYFSGRVEILGNLSKGGGSFQIDHPLDPGNRILRHSFVESPDMMNVYNGNVTTDGRGYATVTLPDWFEVLNRDFRYQLTSIGSFTRTMIAEEVSGNRFVIRTEEPNVRVSWQVTGIRQDAWAEENRIVVEEDKPAKQRGRYFHPTAFGLGRERSVDYDAEMETRMEQQRLQTEATRQRGADDRARRDADLLPRQAPSQSTQERD